MAERYHIVTIAGEERRLRLPVGPLRDAQKVSGKSVGQLLAGLVSLDLDCMATLLWASLRWENHGLKYADVDALLESWIDEGADLEEIAAALIKAAQASGIIRPPAESKGQDEEGEPEGPKAPA